MSDYKKIIFNPRVSSPDEIHDLLAMAEDGTAHPFVEDGKRFLIVKGGGRIDVSDKPDSWWLSAINAGDFEQHIATMLSRFTSGPLTPAYLGYSTRVLNPGDWADVPLIPGEWYAIVLSDKGGSGDYFDFVGFWERYALSYAKTRQDGVFDVHSGDQGSLCHALKVIGLPAVGTMNCLGVVGFPNSKALVEFERQKPAVCLVRHPRGAENGEILIIPCPLDRATIGDSSSVLLATGEVVETRAGLVMRYYIPHRPIRSTGEESSGYTETMKAQVQQSFRDYEAARSTAVQAAIAPAAAEAEAPAADEAEAPAAEVRTGPVVIYQNGFRGIHRADLFTEIPAIGFGAGYTALPQEKTKDVILPVPVEMMTGSASALGNRSEEGSLFEPAHDQIVVLLGSTDPERDPSIIDSCARMGTQNRNAIYIVVVPSETPTSPGEAVNLLDRVNMSAVNNMAGGNSIVLVRVGEAYFWYRGVPIEGLTTAEEGKMPEYGEVFDFNEGKFLAWSASLEEHPLPWPVIVPRDDKTIWTDEGPRPAVEILGWLKSLTVPEVIKKMEKIRTILVQMSMVFDQGEMTGFVNDAYKHFDGIVSAVIDKEMKKLFEAMRANNSEAAAKAATEMKTARRTYDDSLKPLMEILQRSMSWRGVGTAGVVKNRLAAQKAASTKKNVGTVGKMTDEEKWMFIAENTEESGVLCLEVPAESLKRLLMRSKGKEPTINTLFDTTIKQNKMPVLTTPFREPAHMIGLDSWAAMACALNPASQVSELGKNNPIVFCDTRDHGSAILPIPLLDEWTGDWDPRFVGVWPALSQGEVLALTRIMMRGALAGGTFRLVKPGDYGVGFLLMFLLFSGIKSITSGMMGYPAPGTSSKESRNIQAIRSIIAQIFAIAASGKDKCIHPLHGLCHVGTFVKLPDKPDQFWPYIMLAEAFPYTGWHQDIQDTFYHNLKVLCVNVIWKYRLSKVVEAMNKDAKKEKKVEKVKEDIWYHYLRLVIEAVMTCCSEADDAPPFTAELAAALLEASPPLDKISRGTKMLNDIIGFRSALGKMTFSKDKKRMAEGMAILAKIAVFSFSKHSGIVPEGQKKEAKARIHKKKTTSGLYKVYVSLNPEGKPWRVSSPDHDGKLAELFGGPAAAAAAPPKTLVATAAAAPPLSLIELIGAVPGGSGAVEVLEETEKMIAEEVVCASAEAASVAAGVEITKLFGDPLDGVPILELIALATAGNSGEEVSPLRAAEIYQKTVEALITERELEKGRSAAILSFTA